MEDFDRTMIAVFPTVREAKQFVDRLRQPSDTGSAAADAWGYTPDTLTHEGRTVTWQWNGRGSDGHPEGSRAAFRVYLIDMLETVGYYGSAPQGKKATLNGRRAPASY